MTVAQKAAQEHEDHRDHERDGEQQGQLHVLDGGADRLRAVAQDVDVHARRHRGAQARQRSALMRSTVSMTLAPGCLKTTRNTPRLPLAQAAFLASSGPATAWPMSRTRSGAPLR